MLSSYIIRQTEKGKDIFYPQDLYDVFDYKEKKHYLDFLSFHLKKSHFAPLALRAQHKT